MFNCFGVMGQLMGRYRNNGEDIEYPSDDDLGYDTQNWVHIEVPNNDHMIFLPEDGNSGHDAFVVVDENDLSNLALER